VEPSHPSLRLFVSLLVRAKSVIFCRSSPKEKAVIVRFVKRQLGLTVLAIGDGGNDVGMIE
jgi:phospholipid-translocating ATPase